MGSADSGPRLEGPQGEEEEEGAWTCQSRINANECAHPRMSTFGINASLVPVLAHGKKRAIGKEQRAMCHVLCVGVYYPVQDFVHGVHGTWARPVSAALSSTVHSDTVGMVLPF